MNKEKIDALVRSLIEAAETGQGDVGIRNVMAGLELTLEEVRALSNGFAEALRRKTGQQGSSVH